MRGSRGSPTLGLLAASAPVLILALSLVHTPASGAPLALADARSDGYPLVLPSPLPSLPVPLPSLPVPLPSLPLPSVSQPLPSVSLPLPSVSQPLPSVSLPLPSVSQALPSVSVPLPSLSPPSTASAGTSAAPASTAAGARAVGSAPVPVDASDAVASASEDASGDPSRDDRGVAGDRRPPPGAGRVAAPAPQPGGAASWLVPSLAFGVPLLLVIGVVLAQVLGGAAVLGLARRVLSRFPGPMPRWVRGVSDAGDGG
jgi:hypothetical protein